MYRRHPRAETSSSSCSGTASRSSGSSTVHSCHCARSRAVDGAAPTTCTISARTDAIRTTCCCASAPARAVNDPDALRYDAKQFYLKTPEEMARSSPTCPEALDNTVRIAERCNVVAGRGRELPPDFDVPPGLHRRQLLRAGARDGFMTGFRGSRNWQATGRSPHDRRVPATARLRARHHRDDGVSAYFLIVWDFIRYAREQGIPVGPGRGSAAWQPCRLLHAHHRRRSARLRPDVRTLPEPRARVAARYRHRLLRTAPQAKSSTTSRARRPGERRADHHVRHDESEGRGARRRPRAGAASRRPVPSASSVTCSAPW